MPVGLRQTTRPLSLKENEGMTAAEAEAGVEDCKKDGSKETDGVTAGCRCRDTLLVWSGAVLREVEPRVGPGSEVTAEAATVGTNTGSSCIASVGESIDSVVGRD